MFYLYFCIFQLFCNAFLQFSSALNLINYKKRTWMDPQGPRLNAFENYGQFLQTGTSSANSKNIATKNFEPNQFANDMIDASDINAIVKKKFFKMQYPTDLMAANIFCPLCGKLVSENESFSAYQSQSYKRRFLSHDKCLSSESHRLLNDCFDQVEDLVYSSLERNQKVKAFAIGDREFCMQLTISHPLSDYKFIKLVSKGHLGGSTLHWQLRKEDETASYEPNIICFPFVDFKISLIISEIESQQEKKIFTNYVNLSRMKLNSCKLLLAKSQQMILELNIYNAKNEKQQVISAMNYKYRYSEKLSLPIVELLSIEIELPEEEYQDELYENSTSAIVDLLSENAQKSSIASSVNLYSNLQKKSSHFDQFNNSRLRNEPMTFTLNDAKFNEKSSVAQKQKIDLEKLISSGKLSSYVRNAAQSRIFQKFLDEATVDQIDIIIKILLDEFAELVQDEFANYMTQKLFQVSLPTQRLLILSKLFPNIPNLVRNKQGTHTIQAFISTLTLKQQIQLVVEGIKGEFEQLCFHLHSTHFIQKVIKIFPLQQTLIFYEVANKKFLSFATDKNAMCVLKYMLRRVKQQENKPFVVEVKKHFINQITLNTHQIIQDCYGNYVIQFCYELFGEAKSSGITEMIIQKFVQFSLQRYSSSVVSKCINTYWVDKSYVFKLKDALTNEGILEMYRNKDGNKILLDLMDKNQNTFLREKIYNFLASIGEASKFYHQRWDLQKGIKSGPVGFQFKSFTEADTQHKSNQNANNKKSKKK